MRQSEAKKEAAQKGEFYNEEVLPSGTLGETSKVRLPLSTTKKQSSRKPGSEPATSDAAASAKPRRNRKFIEQSEASSAASTKGPETKFAEEHYRNP